MRYIAAIAVVAALALAGCANPNNDCQGHDGVKWVSHTNSGYISGVVCNDGYYKRHWGG